MRPARLLPRAFACASAVALPLAFLAANSSRQVHAAEDAPAHAAPVVAPKVMRIGIEPSPLVLHGPGDRAQVLVTAYLADGSVQDVTSAAEFQFLGPATVSIQGSQIRPLADGASVIRALVELTPEGALPAEQMAPPMASDRSVVSSEAPPTSAPAKLATSGTGASNTGSPNAGASNTGPTITGDFEAKVEQFGVDAPIHFANDVVPMLTKFGCNTGGCHGKQGGQNGFSLSLLGFDPVADYDAIVKQAHGRRVFPAAADRSLLISKPTGESPHGGGRRFEADSEAARLLRRWIEQGLPYGKIDAPHVVKIEALPRERVLPRQTHQQLRVVATYSDDSTRDITASAEYKAQQPDLMAVTPTGLASTLDTTGEGTIMVRYMGLVDVARLTVPDGGLLPETAYANFHPRSPIDELALKKWRKLGISPSARASDQEFLRRASLDLIGTMPTAEEVHDFLADGASDKRDRLIDKLLERDEYASYWANIWGDLLRNKRRNGDQAKRGTFAFAAWIREAFASNMPYDQFAATILTAQGTVSDNPAVIWYREARNQVHQVNDTAQLFMGTRINCANCHHHPYERWSQDDYWGMAAFFGRLGSKPGDVSGENAIYVRKDGGVNQPRTGKNMKPKPLGGPEYEYVHGEDPRRLLADWLAEPDNPYFAPAMTNRLWAHFFGVGLVEAIDDMRVTNPPSNPELLDHLSHDFIAHKFDIKHMMRRMMTSELYGLSSTPIETNAADRRNYARYFPRRMSAEVLADAVDRVTGAAEKYPGMPKGVRAIELPDEGVRSYFLDVFGRSRRETPCECERSYAPNLAQTLHLMNSNEIQEKLTAADGRLSHLLKSGKSPREMVEELYMASLSRSPDDSEMIEAANYIAQAPDKKTALGDLAWVLLNSKEFVFNH